MSIDVVEYVCVFDITQNTMVDTPVPNALQYLCGDAKSDNPIHIMDSIHQLISSKNSGVFDLPHVSDVAYSYCPCYPLTMYSGSVPWEGTPFVVHFIGMDEANSCEKKVTNPLYTSIYVVITRSCTPPVRMFNVLLNELRPTHIRLSELIEQLDNHSGGHGKVILQGWLRERIDATTHSGQEHDMLIKNKKNVLIASTVIVIIAIIYMIRISLRF